MLRVTTLLFTLGMGVAAQGSQYPLNFPADLTTNYSGRAITAVTLKGNDAQGGSITGLPAGTPRPVYHDCTAQTLTLGRGTEVKTQLTAQYNNWMHTYLYIDWNRDGLFATTPDELVTYTCYDERNSLGQKVAWGVALNNIPQFTIPADADGLYHARVVVDWNCKDPGGRYGDKYTDNFINVNGGAVIDFMLNVVEPQKVGRLTLDTRHGNVYAADGTPLPDVLAGVETIKVKPTPVGTGYVLDDDGVTITTDGGTWHYDKVPAAGISVKVEGDLLIKAHYVPTDAAKWVCTFDDEFDQKDGSGPDLTKWRYCARENPTWKRYVSQNPADSVCVVRGGMMSLICKPNPKMTGNSDAMLSGALETKGLYSFTYGKVEIRAKVMPHTGNFPALWMMPVNTAGGWPDCGEIDIFEQIDNETRAYTTIHSRWGNTLGHSGDPVKTSNAYIDTDRFHTYGLEWDAKQLRWYIDGKQTFSYSRVAAHDNDADGQWPFKKDFYLIINQSVGNGSWAANADYSHTYQMLVDWVRVYQTAEAVDISVPSATTASSTACYDLQGRCIKAPLQHGIYISANRKIAVCR